jgi:hypothetical protein
VPAGNPRTGPAATGRPLRRLALGILFALTCAGIVIGLWGLLPYLEPEHRRLEPWKIALIWAGDFTTFACFLWFVVVHLVRGKPLRNRPWSSFVREKRWVLALAALLLGFGLDLAITIGSLLEERAAFPNAVAVMGEVQSVQPILHPAGNHYDLTCRYRDNQECWHEGRYLIEERVDTGFPRALPAPTALAIKHGWAPVDIRVSYDPSWPDRSWLTDVGWRDGNRLHYFSLAVLFLQGICTVGIAANLMILSYASGRVPWCFDLIGTVPFLTEVAFAAFIGPIMRLSAGWVWA